MKADADNSCPLCRAPARECVEYPGATQHAILGTRFEGIALCGSCGLGIALPRFSQAALDRLYATGAYRDALRPGPAQRMHEKVQSKIRVSTCLPHLSGATRLRVLDVGAGHVWTATWLAQWLPGRVGGLDFIEPDDNVCRHALSAQFPFPVTRLADLAFAREGYDLVFLNHVLEHVADPLEFMRVIGTRLRPGGVAYVETPNSDYRFKDDVFPHTYFFTPDAFARLGKLIGVQQLLCEEFGTWPADAGTLGNVRYRVYARLFLWSLAFNWWPLHEWIDRATWRYDEGAPGIWLRWMFRRPA